MKRFSKVNVYSVAGAAVVALGFAVILFQGEPPHDADVPDVLGDQQVQEANRHGAVIYTKLTPKKRVYLQNVDLCPRDGLLSAEAADISRTCNTNGCMTVIDFMDRPIPSEITINRAYNGTCMRQPVQTARFTQVALYQAEIAIPVALGDTLRLSDNLSWTPEHTANSSFREFDASGVNRSGKITLRYAQAVAEDEFLLDEKLIKVKYQ